MPIDALAPYDDQNIFAKILRGEIPNRTVYEDEWALAFHDINPQAPVHVLVIPKGAYVSWDDFTAKAPDAEILGFIRAVGHVARELGLPAPGYRLLANTGGHGHQEV
ncbi:MAG: HIT domain-containing protein, partial [Sphingomonadaceae bacterium]|nr:HIT domain-containing protein [Sphingomonadaceae bacterium]